MHVRTLALILALALSAPAASDALQRPIVTSASELPRRSYQLKGTVAELLADDAQLTRLASELLGNLRRDLDTLDIRDKATLAGYHSTIAVLHALLDEPARALAQIPVMRELETKPATRLTTGLFLEAWAATREQVRDESSPAFKTAFEKRLLAAYANLPYDQIREHVETNKAQSTVMNRELVLGNAQGLQAMLDKTRGTVPEGAVSTLLGIKFMLEHRLPLKTELLRVYTHVSDTHGAAPVAKKDIWTPNEVALASTDVARPIVIAVWDSGVDLMALPEANRFVNRAEVVDGKDNDGNGHVDDVHGIGFDRSRGVYTAGTLEDPTGKITGDVGRLQRLTKGGIDMQAGVRSPEASEVQRVISELKRDEVTRFVEELTFYTGYMHGTHVAGIALGGNPAARILAARMTTDYRQQAPPHTKALAKANAAMYGKVVEYFKKNNVRVVNMSWRYNAASIEGSLAANGVGRDADERRALAREMFDIEKAALFEAIKGAPSILFVCGSGNENNDASFSEYIPASFELPNLVTVGAVDIEGKRTSFTTGGRTVDFYANGHEIESYVPGGSRLKISGTSMASPQVANLAGKLLALNPTLTPAQVIRLIDEGSDPSVEGADLKLINPRKTIALARRTR